MTETSTAGVKHRPKGRSWRYHFGVLIVQNYASKRGSTRSFTSFRTREYVEQTAFQLLGVLRTELGYKIEKPQNLDPRHAEALAKWINGQHEQALKMPATLAGYATVCRHLFRWSGKDKLVSTFDGHLNRAAVERQLVTEEDKSWQGHALSVEAVIEKAAQVEPWVAMALMAQDSFGLRRRESIQLHPLRDIDLEQSLIQIRRGSKGGRPRIIPIEHHWQHEVARALILFVRQRNLQTSREAHDDQPLAAPDKTLLESITRYRKLMPLIGITRKESGVTGHGLRAGYVCRRLQELGVIPVVKGGDGVHPDKETDLRIHKLVSESVGHSRKSVIGAYAGAAHVKERVKAADDMRRRGLLQTGHDPKTIQENVARLKAYMHDPIAYLAQTGELSHAS